MAKLTLSVDEEIVEQMKEIAEEEGKSLSKITKEYYISLITNKNKKKNISIPEKLRGIAGMIPDDGTDWENGYYEYLMKKHAPATLSSQVS